VFLGIIFIFSGFVKGVDPLGTAYKIEDYFIAFGAEWAIPFSLSLAIILCVSEFALGIFLLTNIFKRTTVWLTLLMMIIFTALTLNDALYNPVPDCGCFGDLIILTNWETFYKNLVIDFFLIFVFITRNSFDSVYKKTTEWSIAILTISLFTIFNSYNINRLPIIDFRDWKIGKSLILETTEDLQYYLAYTNKETGETTQGKVKLQLLAQSTLKNGEVKNELIDISIPNNDYEKYKNKVGSTVEVPVGIIAKGQITYYGI